jgi:uncharacterized protein YggE
MVAPDVLRLQLGVEVTRSKAVEAIGEAGEAVSALLESLRAGGVRQQDIRTSHVTLGKYTLQTSEALPPPVFVSSTVLWVTIRDTEQAGQLIDSAIASVGDEGRIYGLSYEFADAEVAQTEARDRAFADARAKAEHYARLAGLTLVGVMSITEGSIGGGFVVTRTSSGSGTNVSPGQHETTASVTVVFDTAPSGRGPQGEVLQEARNVVSGQTGQRLQRVHPAGLDVGRVEQACL